MPTNQICESEGPRGISIVHVEGPLTLGSLFEFQDAVRREHPAGLILALGGIPYMDSAGLGAVLGLCASCQRRGHKFAIAEVAPRVMTLLEVSKVDQLVPRFDTVEAAVQELTGKAAGA